jgi:carboxyl-terminal processing protease
MLIPSRKWAGVAIVVVAFALSGYLTFLKADRGGLELAAIQRDERDLPQHTEVPAEMGNLTDLYRTINFIQKRYIDTSRIDPRAMFIGAMRAIQLNVAQVMVREADDTLFVTLGATKKRFFLKDLDTPWVLLQRMKQVFQLLAREFTDDEIDFDEVEYAAINGMLRTLDPHSVFLNAEQYRDMKDKTQGNFAGLGIVISIRDGVLTIISPMDGTPADKAGLEAGDQIIKIDDQSTVNMSLNDAVDLLRGDPGTTVTVHIMRRGWDEPKPFVIARAIVKVESLESHMLSGRVGYIRIKDFQGNTAQDIKEEMTEWHRSGLRGLILDLRDCPGGLLEAAVQVADLFLKQGVIVTTAGQGPGEREVRRAEDSGEEPGYPLVVLVDQGSASASEILAGALKNHNRALLMGERTFGKGSVQVLFEFHEPVPNKTTALKLTTAQYLTPGDISIQSFGVIPHVEILPMRADKELIDLKVKGGYRESDLDHHFKVSRPQENPDHPLERLSYLWEPPALEEGEGEGEDRDGGPPAPEYGKEQPFEPDFSVSMARDLVIKSAHSDKGALDLAIVKKLVEDRGKTEEKKLESALKELGIDWRSGRGAPDASDLEVAVTLDSGELVQAGESAIITMSLTNKGTGVFYRLAATSNSDFRPLDDRELAFGKVGPEETVSRELKFKVPKDALKEVNDVRFTFSAQNSDVPRDTAFRFAVNPLPVPRFAYRTRLDDTKKGNGDGRLEKGESVELVVDVHNIGQGPAVNTYATLKSLSKKELFMIKGREPLKEIAPDGHRQGVFAFEVKPDFQEEEARFELAVADVDLKAYLVEKLVIPVYSQGQRPEDDPRKAPDADTSLRSPPVIQLDVVDLVTVSDKVHVRGKVTDTAAVRDMYIFVGDDKLFFKSNKNAETTEGLAFDAELPLKNGINYITIVAEETSELDSRKILAVRRDREDGMPYMLPRSPEADPEPLGVLPQNAKPAGGWLSVLANAPAPLSKKAEVPAPLSRKAPVNTGDPPKKNAVSPR